MHTPGKLFLGNVPAEATEEDLRPIFAVIDGLQEAAGSRGASSSPVAKFGRSAYTFWQSHWRGYRSSARNMVGCSGKSTGAMVIN